MELRDRDRQRESPRAGATRIQVEDVNSLLGSGLVGVSGDDGRESSRARFEVDRGDFDAFRRATAGAEATGDWIEIAAPERIGSFGVDEAYRSGVSVLVVTSTPNFGLRSGFAYLPDGTGVFAWFESFADADFDGLGRGWYSFRRGI